MTESQSDIDNDAEIYATPSESYNESKESADEKPYKEPRETITVQYVTTPQTAST